MAPTARSSARISARPSWPRRALNATQIVLGATRRSRLRVTRGSVINRVIRDSGVGLDVHVISRAKTGPAPRRPERATARAATTTPLLGFGLAARTALLPCADASPRHSACRASSCSSSSSSSRLGCRRRLAGARRGGRRLPSRQLVLHAALLHVHDLRGREPPCALGVPRCRCDREHLRRSRRPACGGRRPARAEAEALARLAGAAPADAAGRPTADPRARRRRRPPREGALAAEASSGLRAPEADRRPDIELDDVHVLALAGSSLRGRRADPRRVRPRDRPPSSSRSSRQRSRRGPSPRRASCARPSSPPSPTTCGHRCRPIKASVTSLLQDDVEWSPETREFLGRSTRRPTASTPWSATSST